MRIGIAVSCTTCGQTKKPIGRDASMSASYCDDDCPGYRKDPRPGSLWPGERQDDFGYPVSAEATKEEEEEEEPTLSDGTPIYTRQKPTRQEKLQARADRGYDTPEEND